MTDVAHQRLRQLTLPLLYFYVLILFGKKKKSRTESQSFILNKIVFVRGVLTPKKLRGTLWP